MPAPNPAVVPPRARHPWVWAVLYFPYGLTFGFPAIALGYLAGRAGVATSAVAGMVGMAFLAAGWKFVWAPLGDYTLSRKRWYLLAVAAVSAGFVALTALPLSSRTVPLAGFLVLVSGVAATFLAFATEGLMVHNTPAAQRGRAAGWFQSGNQFGQTAGGGVGLWLIHHSPSPWMAGIGLTAIIGACALALRGLEEPPRPLAGASFGARIADVGRELGGVLRSRAGRVGLLLAILPIGTAAAQFLFGALGPEWHASADTVSFVLGAGGGLAIVTGCFAGGRLADRIAKTRAYAVACALMILACVALAVSPRTEAGYAAATLFYIFANGMGAASFTALVLAIIGDSAAATKINLFFALNTLFSLGMLRVDGWAHDAWATNGMLYTEAGAGVLALVVFAALAPALRGTAGVAATRPAERAAGAV